LFHDIAPGGTAGAFAVSDSPPGSANDAVPGASW
jgi:hypothetical protein